MQRAPLIIAGALAAIFAAGLASSQSGGGFPSRPTFATVKATGATSANGVVSSAPANFAPFQAQTATTGNGLAFLITDNHTSQSHTWDIRAGNLAPQDFEIFDDGTAQPVVELLPTTDQAIFPAGIAGTARNIIVRNATAGTTSAGQVSVQNDLASTAHELELGYTSSTFSGAFLTGGPTGESAFINTAGANSICIGTNNVCRLNVTAAGTVLVPGALTVTGALTAAGVAMPKVSYGHVVQGAGTCVVSASFQQANIASCTFVATGVSTVTFSSAYTTNPPVCTPVVFQNGAGTWTANTSTASNTAVNVQAMNSGVAANSQIDIACMGN
jgi:hypothetical protein